MRSLWTRFAELLSTPVDGASLAVFRICVGLLVVLTACSLLKPGGFPEADYVVTVGEHFSTPPAAWHFPYHGFEWIRPWPAPGMTLHCVVYLLAGLCVALGLYYRAAIIVAWLARTYVFLLDEAIYNNHYYLECLLLFLLVWMPAERCLSLDRWRLARRAERRAPPSNEIPFWCVFLLRAQLFVVYFYGGVTKLQHQYLVEAQPMRTLLAQQQTWAPLERWLPSAWFNALGELAARSEIAYLLNYSGLVYDLAIGFLMIFRRTRALGIVLTLVFHGLNHFLFFDDIGWFPLLGVTSITIFLEPDWPRRAARAIRERMIPQPDWRWLVGGAIVLPIVGAALGWRSKPTPRRRPAARERLSGLALAAISAWVGFQAVWPLRHFAIAGDVNWTSEGDRFSWRMKNNLKVSRPPIFRLEDAAVLRRDSAGQWQIDWRKLGERPVVYRDVAAANVDWQRMPELFVEYLPLVGERLIFNPWHGLAADEKTPDDADARARMNELWRSENREPLADDRLLATHSLPEVLLRTEEQLARGGAAESAVALAAEARELAERLETAAPGEPGYDDTISRVQLSMLRLLEDPEHGPTLAQALRSVVPFGTSGGRMSGARTYVVDVPELYAKDRHGRAVLDRDRAGRLGDVDGEVFAELDRNLHWEWSSLPRVIVYGDAQGNYQLLWNQHADLLRLQDSMMQTRPFMIHQYAERIAELWAAEHGRRPRVRVTAFVALVPRASQWMIDPRVDLAAEPLRLFGHNDWIVPLAEPAP